MSNQETEVDSASALEKAGDNSTTRPQAVQHPTIDDVAQLPDAKEETANRQPKTVKLPPKNVQEKHLKDIEAAQEDAKRRERKEDEALHLSGGNLADLASSPSSTIGAHSTSFTPKATNVSPDTSPEADSRRGRDGDEGSSGSSDAAYKEQRDNLLESRMKTARETARESSPTGPDAQLRLEEQEAARLAQTTTPSRPLPKDSELVQRAADFVNESKAAYKETS